MIQSKLAVSGHLQKWNAEEYNSNSSVQLEASKKLLKQLAFQGTEDILDVGCGDGKITALISAYIPQGKILGLDLSPEMIEFANKHFPASEYENVSFVQQDASKLDFHRKFDVVFSSFALHWVKDFQAYIVSVNEALKENGKIAFTIPLDISDPLEQATQEAINDPSWAHYFDNYYNPWLRDTDTYTKMIKEANFKIISVETIPHVKLFESKAAFEAYVIQWYPYVNYVDEDKKGEFFSKVIDRSLELNPCDPSGRVYFEFKRIDVIAQRSCSFSPSNQGYCD